jgi:hypothetical protein
MGFFSWNDGDDREVHIEDGTPVPPDHRTGRAGRGPGRREDATDKPRMGWSRSWAQGGPTRGHARSGNDRRGGWIFGRGSAGRSEGKGGKH